jgi:hypothetical protein
LVSSQRVVEETKINADTRALRLPAVLNRVALISLRQRYEREFGRVTDKVWPCAALVERMLEEAAEGSCTAPLLSEVISIDECADEVTSIQEIGTAVRIRKAPKNIQNPATTEELRQRFETMGIAYVLASYNHSSRLWLRTATMTVFDAHVKFLLSEDVAAYKLDQDGLSIKASWNTVLAYDLGMRKWAVRQILYANTDFATAMTAARTDLSVREKFFITPTALLNSCKGGSSSSSGGADKPKLQQQQTQQQQQQPKAKSGGKGDPTSNRKRKLAEFRDKRKAKGKAKGSSKGDGKSQKKTPDGRLICSFFNTEKGCVKGDECTWVHVCSNCLGAHSMASKSC